VRMTIDRDTQGVDIFKVLKKCRWPKDDKERWWVAGQMIGARNQMVHVYDGGVMMINRFGHTKSIKAKPGDVFKYRFLHHYFHNSEGFVDVFEILIDC